MRPANMRNARLLLADGSFGAITKASANSMVEARYLEAVFLFRVEFRFMRLARCQMAHGSDSREMVLD